MNTSRFYWPTGYYSRYGLGERMSLPSTYQGYGSMYGSTLYDYTPYPFTYSYDVPTVRDFQRSMYGRTPRSMSDYGYRQPYGIRSTLFGYKEPKYNILPDDDLALEYYSQYPRYSRHHY